MGVQVPEGVRQSSRASAFVTYGYNPSNLAAYIAALESADNTFIAAVNAAALTLSGAGYGPASGAGVPNVNPAVSGLARQAP